ncbi:MAG: Rieske 2Fe-2S domain-containing protein [Actinomycetota bacterium]
MTGHMLDALTEMPDGAFTSEGLFVREMGRLFRARWCFALPTGYLQAPGHRACLRVAGRELLVVADREGVIRAFPNNCLHKGETFLHPGQGGTSSLLRCPHHGWCYALDGRLVRGPGFDLSSRPRAPSLPAIPLSTQGACILVGPGTGGNHVVVRRRSGEVTERRTASVAANWKLVARILCERRWGYALPNLASRSDERELLRLEPRAPGWTDIVLHATGRGSSVLDKLATTAEALQARVGHEEIVEETIIEMLADAMDRSIAGQSYLLSEES